MFYCFFAHNPPPLLKFLIVFSKFIFPPTFILFLSLGLNFQARQQGDSRFYWNPALHTHQFSGPLVGLNLPWQLLCALKGSVCLLGCSYPSEGFLELCMSTLDLKIECNICKSVTGRERIKNQRPDEASILAVSNSYTHINHSSEHT